MTSIVAVEPVVVNVSPKTNWTFVGVRTSAGDIGWGECSLNGWEPMLVAYAAMLAREAVGCDIEDTDQLVGYLPHTPGGVVAGATRLRKLGIESRQLVGGPRRLASRKCHESLGFALASLKATAF